MPAHEDNLAEGCGCPGGRYRPTPYVSTSEKLAERPLYSKDAGTTRSNLQRGGDAVVDEVLEASEDLSRDLDGRDAHAERSIQYPLRVSSR